MRILVAHTDPMFRRGVTSLLQQQEDFEVVGEAQYGIETIEKARTLEPDIVLMAVRLPGLDDLEAVRRIKSILPYVKMIVCTDSEHIDELSKAIQAGVHGYLPRQIEPQGLFRAIRGVYHGEAALCRRTTLRLFEAFACLMGEVQEANRPHEQLSPREQEVFELLSTGASNKQIASNLGISENTVKSHLKNILAKLNLQSRVQVAVYALRFKKYDKGHLLQDRPDRFMHAKRLPDMYPVAG